MKLLKNCIETKRTIWVISWSIYILLILSKYNGFDCVIGFYCVMSRILNQSVKC